MKIKFNIHKLKKQLIKVFVFGLLVILAFNPELNFSNGQVIKRPVELETQLISYTETLFLGDEFSVTVKVLNKGNETAEGIRVEFRVYRNFQPITSPVSKYVDVPTGASLKLTFRWKPLDEGIYSFRVRADSLDKYQEQWEWDNEVSGEFTVASKPISTPTPVPQPKLHLFDIDKVGTFIVAYGVKGHINDREAINTIKENFPIYSIRQDIYVTCGPGSNLAVIGGPIVNALARKYNALLKVSFEKRKDGVKLVVNQSIYKYKWDMFGVEDYAVLAVFKCGGVNVWLFEGCTRYGTQAATWYLINKPGELVNIETAVIHWVDLDSSGNVTSNDLFEILYKSDT